MNFEEQFPSLTGEDGTVRTGYYTTGLYLNDGYAICQTGIKKHCLDKKRVIYNVREELKKHGNSKMSVKTLANVILLKSGCTKEDLGLNGDVNE